MIDVSYEKKKKHFPYIIFGIHSGSFNKLSSKVLIQKCNIYNLMINNTRN